MKDIGNIGKTLSTVTAAAASFESRWTLAALRRVDVELHRRLIEQRSLYDKAAITGTEAELETHAAAMVRGWGAAVRAMDGQPDDAYLLGQDHETGVRVAVGHQRAGAERVAELHGQDVIWMTPDEVAQVMARLQVFQPIADLKRVFPGTVMDVRKRTAA